MEGRTSDMKINDLDTEIKQFLYKRFLEQTAAVDVDAMELSYIRNQLDFEFEFFSKIIKYHYDNYAPNIQTYLDQARKITEPHWNIQIEWI